jgi:hypothetical protein
MPGCCPVTAKMSFDSQHVVVRAIMSPGCVGETQVSCLTDNPNSVITSVVMMNDLRLRHEVETNASLGAGTLTLPDVPARTRMSRMVIPPDTRR